MIAGGSPDVIEAIDRIEKVTCKGKTFFYDDEMAQVWVIHHLRIIGEAVRGISHEFRNAHPVVPWSDINGMRNVLTHQYFGIDKDAVWNVVEQDLPELKKQVSRLVSG